MRFRHSLAAALVVGSIFAVPHDSRAAPDNTLGMGLMSANVNADGTLVANSGSGVVSSIRNALGFYTVKFSRSLAGCSCVGSHFAVGGVTEASIAVTGFCESGVDDDEVTVRTYQNSSGAFSDRQFQLIRHGHDVQGDGVHAPRSADATRVDQ